MKKKNRFVEKYLTNVIWPTNEQTLKESWDVEGVIKGRSNQSFKFDWKPLIKVENDKLAKKVSFSNKSDKIVFESIREYIIVDKQEIDEMVKNKGIKTIDLNTILKECEWNIVLKKS